MCKEFRKNMNFKFTTNNYCHSIIHTLNIKYQTIIDESTFGFTLNDYE